ncbi:MAG: ABC transporter ATP-binding protein [Kiritimatiellaeota bacterium]|nr:ABC transporter ATP-binding protein [Kiritimatiellota bacterium]
MNNTASVSVDVIGLRKTFGKTVAVNDIGFRIPSGHVFGFVGPNGAGKTTALRIMATLDEPDRGDVLVNGRSIVDYPEEGRRLIGFMPDALPESMDITAHEYLDFFARAYGLKGNALERRVEETETFTGLYPFRDKTLAALSKGMKQRVSLGRALVHDPALLLLDEPAAGLDPRARIELKEMIHALAQQGKTLLISSHILSELAEMCSGVLIIERGNLLRQGTLSEISSRDTQTACEVAIRLKGGADIPEGITDIPVCDKKSIITDRNVCVTLQTCRREGEEWIVTVGGGEAEAAALLAHLVRHDVPVCSFHLRRATLEDIFMTVTKGELA